MLAAEVVAIYPSAPVLPKNLLKFYVHFSEPMSRGEAWRRIALLDERGNPVELPFLELDQELWDPRQTRLTILFDPGRIKRGVTPKEEIGEALEAGRSYTLAIAREWADAGGKPLAKAFEKKFRVADEDRTPFDPKNWKVSSPRAETRDTLVVTLPEPADHALLERLLRVESVTGETSVTANETEWRFVPAQPWREGEYRVMIDTRLEDLAGNKVGRPFDVDMFDRVTKKIDAKEVPLAFRVE
jgi:hypothetical protein